jgi:superfamily I DNA/RNA helicase
MDEFQDTCPVELELMTRAVARGQICAIGDPDQAIYSFKGTTPKVFDIYKDRWDAKELPLSICYRCPKAIIRAAQKFVPRIEWAPWAEEGVLDTIQDKDFYGLVKEGDFVLCRTTDELVAKCIGLIKMGRKGKVRGRDFGDGLKSLILKVDGGQDMPIKMFIEALIGYRMYRVNQLMSLRKEGEILSFEDRCNTIEALCTDCSRASDIFKQADKVFSDEAHDGVDFMSIHKSKGLQARNVFLLRPDLLPHPRAKERQWMLEEERRLHYVALTRSKFGFWYVRPELTRKNYWT